MVAAQKLDNEILEIIRRDRPEWDGKRGICKKCREQYRAKKFLSYLEVESQKISDMKKSLIQKIARRGRVTKIVEKEFEEHMTFGDRLADSVARLAAVGDLSSSSGRFWSFGWPRTRGCSARRGTSIPIPSYS